MHLISHKKLKDFYQKHDQAENAMNAWYKIIDRSDFDNFTELRKIFPSADKVGKFIVFNVGGNKYRIITVIHFNRKRCYIRDVLTHKEYDLGKWKEE